MTQQPPSSPPPKHTSRRGALRVTGLNIQATFTLEGAAPQRGIIIDISATGALLVTSKPLTAGQKLHVTFAVPKGPRIDGPATVARYKQTDDGRHGAGVAFAISVEQELDLAQWVFDRV